MPGLYSGPGTIAVPRLDQALPVNLPPPASISDATAIKQYYAIFDGPARWKAGIRTPREALAPARKLNLSFKVRERGKPLVTTHLN